MNHKRVYRLYSQEGLMLRNKKPKRHVSCQRRTGRQVAAGVDESWSMDFMSDELFDESRIRLLTIVDNFPRERLGRSGFGSSIRGQEVVEVLQRLMEQRRLPKTIRVDNGPEFTSKRLDQWAYLDGVELDFRPARQAHGQRLHRGIQREIPAGMSERELVPVPGRCRGKGGNLAETLQWRQAAQRPGEPDPKGIRRAGGNWRLTRKTSTMAGTGNRATLLLVYDSVSS